METAKININTDKETKQAAEHLFDQLGMNMTTAINMFLKRSILENGIPFEVSLNTPNSEMKEAIEELREMKAHPEKYAGYRDIEALRAALGV